MRQVNGVGSEAVGRRGAVAVADDDVGVTVEAVADPTHGAHDVFVPAQLGAQAPHVHDDAPGERTIDVHVRRLRAKLGRYEDIVRTVRGVGYRFDRHADVVIRYGHGTPSPDRF